MTDYQIMQIALEALRDNLDRSAYDASMKHQILLRLNRMIAGVVSDSNPEGLILDSHIYELGLNLILVSNHSIEIKQRAERILEENDNNSQIRENS